MSEELKAIVEVISSLGEDGVKAFIWYLAATLFTNVLTIIGILAGVVVLVKSALKLFGACSGLERLARAMRPKDGYPPHWSDCCQRAIDSRFWEK